MKTVLKWIGIVFAGLLGLLLVAIAGLVIYAQFQFKPMQADRPLYPIAADTSPEGVSRGKYLMESVMGCTAGCHTPEGGTPYTGNSEKIALGPASVDFNAPNLTSDPETGLGAWSDAEIARAIREGVSRDGRALVIMPSFNYHVLSDEDTADIIGYLRSLPPVRNAVKPFDANAFGKVLIALNIIMPPSLGEPIEVAQYAPPVGSREYGDYLVSIASCRDCHKPDLTGGPMIDSGLLAPDLTPAGGFAAWTEAEFITAMRTGKRPDGRQLVPMMPYEMYGQMEDADLVAMFQYLQALPGVASKR